MRNRTAFSIVEVLVALVVFSIAALGSAAALGLSARVQREAVARREALSALELRMATLATLPCDSLTAGTDRIYGVAVTSRVTRTDSLVAIAVTATHKGTTTTLGSERSCD
jgi:prepilin-type N-terminal cleavage/methylation domain-containing protein